MKIAVVTDDEVKISAHFGQAEKYVVFTVEAGQIVEREVLEKSHHKHGHSRHEQQQANGIEVQEVGEHKEPGQGGHGQMFAPIDNVDVLLAGGMGQGALRNLSQRNIQVVLTDIKVVEDAVQATIDRTIVHNSKRLHNHSGGHHH